MLTKTGTELEQRRNQSLKATIDRKWEGCDQYIPYHLVDDVESELAHTGPAELLNDPMAFRLAIGRRRDTVRIWEHAHAEAKQRSLEIGDWEIFNLTLFGGL